MASALAGAWRMVPPSDPPSSAALGQAVSLLLKGGAGGLAWWRVREDRAIPARVTRPLREAFRHQTLRAALRERELAHALDTLRSAGVEPLLIKGSSCARCYPEPGLRPLGDIDLCVAPQQFEDAHQAFQRLGLVTDVDLHAGCPDLPDRAWPEIFQRSQMVRIGQTDVRVLGPEDHLRLLAIHLIRHGGFRPLWLCDVAAALESRPDNFDWSYFHAGNRLLVDWALSGLGLACRLLKASSDHPSVQDAARRVPRWMERTVLWHWGNGRQRETLRHYLRHPVEALVGLHHDGLNPIRTAFHLGLSPHTRWPLLLVQLAGWSRVISARLKRSIASGLRSLFRRGQPPLSMTSEHEFATDPGWMRRQYARSQLLP